MTRNATRIYAIFLILMGIGIGTAFYLQLGGVKLQNNNLYLHPFAVSNAVKNIEVNLLRMATQSADKKNSSNTAQAQAQAQEMLRDIEKVRSQYLGNPHEIEQLEIKINRWLKDPKTITDPSTQSIHINLSKIHNYANNKAKYFYDESQSIRIYFFSTFLLLGVYLLACTSFLYKKRLNTEKRLSRKLLNSKKRFEHLLNYTPNAVIIAAKDGRVIDISTQATELFGHTQTEFKQFNIAVIIPDMYGFSENPIDPMGDTYLQKDRHTQAILKNGELADISINVNIAAIDDEVTMLASIRDIREELAYKEKIFQQANYDFLTQLPNRSLATDRFEQLRSLAERNNEHIAVIFIDLDDFKKINDTLGHETGDKLLVRLAKRLTDHLRQEDTIARLGGDEFIILLRSNEPISFFENKAKEVLSLIKKEFEIDNRKLNVSGSMGIALFPENGRCYSELLRKSDAAMYHSKAKGFNHYSFYLDSMSIEVSRRFSLEEEMLGALERGEILVFFQPQVDLLSGKIIGAEALCRWNNKRLGHVPPDEFISIAEYNGEIISIGRHVITESIALTRKIDEDYNFDNFKISVNLSPRQFSDEGLIHFIHNELSRNNLHPNRLTLEVTEGALIDNDVQALSIFDALCDTGIELSMDDFGTGYSSLSHLRKYPFDHIKLDKTFVADITTSSRELLSAAIAMAHALKLKVVAEGVETQAQLDVLAQLNCEFAQGYLFSPALETKAFFEFIKTYVPNIEGTRQSSDTHQPNIKRSIMNKPCGI